MKRSEINAYIADSKAFFAAHHFRLPPWGTWTPEEWRRNPDMARWCRDHQMGWDITDYGAENFLERGLILFCLRNGLLGVPGEVPYAEKIMIVREDQEAPFHFHDEKVEDIIVRGGGNLVLEMYNADADHGFADTPVSVRTDGRLRTMAPGEKLVIGPGESITLPQRVYHRFYAEAGSGTALVGEVSKVNDDLTDNHFVDVKGRFSEIEEDEPPLHPLWNELPTPTDE